MLYELVLPIVPHTTRITPVRLLVGVSSLVVISVPNCRESLGAVLALVWLFPSVDSHMHQKVAPLVELFVAVGTLVVWHTVRICLWLQAGFALAASLK